MISANKSLTEALEEYSSSGALPMHMPGHKRNADLFPELKKLGAELDITEIDGFSNLHDPDGAISERMRDAAALWGSLQCWWSVGGSTAGILASVSAALPFGQKVLIARNCHKSVYNACMLRHADVSYILPDLYPGQTFCGAVTPEILEPALLANPGTILVIVTSPTYEGICSDVPALAEVCHRHGCLLLVDSAHGAHLGFSDAFPASPVRSGADIVVQSLHKTLTGLTQTGLVHLCSDRVSAADISFWLSVYESSSPSYLLMASIDYCVRSLKENASKTFSVWERGLSVFYRSASALKHLSLPLAGLPNHDYSRIVVSCRGCFSGYELSEILRKQYGIETEMSSGDYVIALTGIGDNEVSMLRLANALLKIDGRLSYKAAEVPAASILPSPVTEVPMHVAISLPKEEVLLSQAVDRISAGFIWAYPPGIPLLAPGEKITEEVLRLVVRELCPQSLQVLKNY